MQHIGIFLDQVIASAYTNQPLPPLREEDQKQTADPRKEESPDTRRQQNNENGKIDSRTGRDTKVHRGR